MAMVNKQPIAPQQLTENEIADPQLVIDDLFDFAHLPDIRELLWDWLKVTVTGTYHKDLSASERSAILTLYEKMNRLVEAAHVIHTRSLKADKKRVRKTIKAQKS